MKMKRGFLLPTFTINRIVRYNTFMNHDLWTMTFGLNTYSFIPLSASVALI